ncbi:thermonuclease family protein [Cytobacillus praedii]|uniref:thermonuclease family protein n=1 Tax=Cytobacillus praedii TaxID=1742358 RepID=UPI002E241628|nr:thermonuclease family protein [Cytobacillus praedii]
MDSGKLTIEFDLGDRVDKYGRLLAYVYMDGESVQEKLVEEGLARVAYVYPPNTRYLTEFEKAQQNAKDKNIGIWSNELMFLLEGLLVVPLILNLTTI